MAPKNGNLNTRKAKERGREIEAQNRCEEDWPHKDHVNEDVCWVAVISSVESEVLFQIKQSLNLPH